MIETLRSVSASLRDLPQLLRIVRSAYRKRDRKPHLEPAYVNWIERYVRFYQTKPLGLLDSKHVSAFLTHLARRPGISPADQEQALDALKFFHADVLQAPIDTVGSYTRAKPRRRSSTTPDGEGRSFWRLDSSMPADD